MAETTKKDDTKKDQAPKTMRVRATALGFWGNRRRRPGAEFSLTLSWIPEQRHARALPSQDIKKGDVVDGTGRHQKMPSWVIEIAADTEPAQAAQSVTGVQLQESEMDGTDGDDLDDGEKSDETPL